MPEPKTTTEINELGRLLLEIGAVLMSSGANTGRIRTTITRISDAFGYRTELLITHRAIMLTLISEDHDYFFNNLKRTLPHGVNFTIVSGISSMSWAVVHEHWSVQQIRKELERLMALPHYPRWVVLVLVSLAGASFCRLAGGYVEDMIIVFVATLTGQLVRHEAARLRFNTYLCVYFAALAATLVVGLALKFGAAERHEQALATCVLFLIPGVPLINALSDLIDGNLQNGIVRGLNGLIIAFAIALGMITSVLIYQLK